MNKTSKYLIHIIFITFLFSITNSSYAEEINYSEILENIADEISTLKESYPQLAEFSTTKNLQTESLTISYEYKTHEPKRRGGWTSGVPNPDPDGLWFYIDLHDPNSIAQIHTQPVVQKGVVGEKEVMFLILEGEKTKPLSGKIWEILKNNGISLKQRP